MKSIYLCGFMGCGKSRIGKAAAKSLNMPFVDLDSYIVKKEGMDIPKIFEEKGEEYFRRLEGECLKELEDGYVVATGGGTLINKNTAEYANQHGITVFLDASFPVCYGRIRNDTNRPLVMNNTKKQLEDIFNKRKEIYKAHSRFVIKAEGTVESITDSIIKKVKEN